MTSPDDVREIPAFQCSLCERAYFGRGLAAACAEACRCGAQLKQMAIDTGVAPEHSVAIAIGPWPEGTDPPCVPGVRVAVRWVKTEIGLGRYTWVSGWGAPRDDEADVRPEIATQYTLTMLRMMEARARADDVLYEGVRAPKEDR